MEKTVSLLAYYQDRLEVNRSPCGLLVDTRTASHMMMSVWKNPDTCKGQDPDCPCFTIHVYLTLMALKHLLETYVNLVLTSLLSIFV